MSGYDGGGVYTRVTNFQGERDAGTKILASHVDGEFDAMAAAFNMCLLRSGIVPMAGDLDVGGNSVKNLANGVVGTPALRFQNDLSAGFFLNGVGKPALAVGGVARLQWDSQGIYLNGTMRQGVSTIQPVTFGTSTGGAAYNANASQFASPSASVNVGTAVMHYTYGGIGSFCVGYTPQTVYGGALTAIGVGTTPTLGEYDFAGWDGANFVVSASIRAQVIANQPIGAGRSYPTRLYFGVGSRTSGNVVENMALDADRLSLSVPVSPGSYTVAALPTANIPTGAHAFSTNGRRAGQGVGAGTGCPVWYDGATWRTYYDNTVAAA